MWDGDLALKLWNVFVSKSSEPTVWDGDDRYVFAIAKTSLTPCSEPTVWDGDLAFCCLLEVRKVKFRAHRVGWRLELAFYCFRLTSKFGSKPTGWDGDYSKVE